MDLDVGISLRLDISTRWNSTYLMLDSALKYENTFVSLQLVDRNFKYCPTHDEWRRGEKIYEFLEPFYQTAKKISGSFDLTSNLYFLQV